MNLYLDDFPKKTTGFPNLRGRFTRGIPGFLSINVSIETTHGKPPQPQDVRLLDGGFADGILLLAREVKKGPGETNNPMQYVWSQRTMINLTIVYYNPAL